MATGFRPLSILVDKLGTVTKITIKHVAERAGVSTMTVSRVLNNRPDVAADTRRRIQEVIDELGYAPNMAARGLKGRSRTLGVVATGIEYYGPSRTLASIERRANELGLSLLLSLTADPENDSGEDTLINLLAHQIEGILWAVPEIGSNREWLYERIQSIDTPVVFLNVEPRPDISMSAVDNFHGGKLATNHLVEQGYRNIGIVTGPLSWWEARQRLEGWKSVLYEHNMAADIDRLQSYGDWSPASGEAGLLQLLGQARSLDAVFASNDQMALGILKAAQEVGLRVPDDLAIVGFDDIPESAYFSPPLTTIKQGLTEMGATTVNMLHQLIEAKEIGEETPPFSKWITPQLVVRKSSINIKR
jgi:LacI family transcriptional regulator